MTSSQSYYRSIYEIFNRNEPTLSLSEFLENNSDNSDLVSNYNSKLDDNYCSYYQDIVLNKEEAKKLRKFHEEIVNSYASKLSHLHQSTIDSYANIVSRFILYSPSLDHKDLESFISERFKIKQIGGTFESHLHGTSRKYFLCLNKFLDHVYSENYYLNDECNAYIHKTTRK